MFVFRCWLLVVVGIQMQKNNVEEQERRTTRKKKKEQEENTYIRRTITKTKTMFEHTIHIYEEHNNTYIRPYNNSASTSIP